MCSTLASQRSLTFCIGGEEDEAGRFQWQTKIPEDVGKPAEDADSLRYAILVRMIKVYCDPRRTLSLHSIVVQSPLLKDLLQGVLAGYPGVTVDLSRLEFSGNFEPLIHRWKALETAIAKLKSDAEEDPADEELAERVKHGTLLQDLLETEFRDTINASQDMMEKGVINYDLLWIAFQPGCLVYAKYQGQERVLRLSSSKYGRDRDGGLVFWLVCQYVDFDGFSFGMNKLNISIAAYQGTCPLL